MRLPKPNAAEINRSNSQHSTGPRTAEGKSRSSQNAFKHGLHSKKFIFPDECAAEFDELRATLRREHQPINTTEEILVDELAQHFWRMRRFRELEANAWQPESKLFTTGILALLARNLASAERGFYRSLAALTKLQKARGFVPQKQPAAAAAAANEIEFIAAGDERLATELGLHQPPLGFVPPFHEQAPHSATHSDAKTPHQTS